MLAALLLNQQPINETTSIILLEQAVDLSMMDVLQILLADPRIRVTSAILAAAINKESISMIELLLNYVDVTTNNNIAVAAASAGKHKRIMDLLIAAGAQPTKIQLRRAVIYKYH
jgi:hypothetical protein